MLLVSHWVYWRNPSYMHIEENWSQKTVNYSVFTFCKVLNISNHATIKIRMNFKKELMEAQRTHLTYYTTQITVA